MLDSQGIFRIVKDLCVAELTQSRRAPGSPFSEVLDQTELWTSETVLLERHCPAGQHCLCLDSLERISIAAAINQFFRLHDWGVEDNLLRQKTLGELASLVQAVLLDKEEPWRALTVLSSGSTGEARRVRHERRSLEAECASWKGQLPDGRRIVSLIPAHHLYGLVWTVLLPAYGGLEVADARAWGPGQWKMRLQAGDVIVAVPLQWELLPRTMDALPAGVIGVSSAGRLPEAAWNALREAGLSRMIEVYGSTETGGVATRESHSEPFQLAQHWLGRKDQLPELLPDLIEPAGGEGQFRILERKDGGVKVAGTLVYPSVVERALLELAGVEDARVRYSGTQERARLEALIVTHVPKSEHASWELEITSSLARTLPDAAVPRRYRFCDRLPVNAMGKVTAW